MGACAIRFIHSSYQYGGFSQVTIHSKSAEETQNEENLLDWKQRTLIAFLNRLWTDYNKTVEKFGEIIIRFVHKNLANLNIIFATLQKMQTFLQLRSQLCTNLGVIMLGLKAWYSAFFLLMLRFILVVHLHGGHSYRRSSWVRVKDDLQEKIGKQASIG